MTAVTNGGAWTLKARMLKWLAGTTVPVALGLAILGAWFVHAAGHRQANALLKEELDEVVIAHEFSQPQLVAFDRLATDLAESHPDSELGWRIWSPVGDVLGEFGDTTGLSPAAPGIAPLDEPVPSDDGHRWQTTRLPSGHYVGLILDEGPHLQPLRTFGLAALFVTLIGFSGIFGVGFVFIRRISEQLAQIASRARSVDGQNADLDLPADDLPDEVRDVAMAFEEMLRNIRAESRESRLLIAGLAHELRSPIQNLMGETEVALLADRDPQRYRDVLSSHLEELRDLGDAVHNLVALCSARRAELVEAVEEFDLVVEARLRLERELLRAEREGIDLSIHVQGRATLQGDREGLLTAIRNLISNAIDWTPEGGTIQLRFDDLGDTLRITADDSGPGIPSESHREIFKAFFRGPSASGRRIGYGLGLALASTAVQRQGGTIEVGVSDLGGARFTINLPRERRGPVAGPGGV